MNNLLRTPGWLRLPSRAVLLGLAGLLTLTVGQQTSARESIDLNWAAQQTLDRNPELQAYPYRLRGAEALKAQAKIAPLPRLGFEVENVLGSGDKREADNAEITLSLSQVIEMGGKRQYRVDVADADIAQQQLEYELARLDILAETGRRYYQLLRLQALQNAIAGRIDQERQALKIVRKRAQAGAVGQADVSKMALRLARSEMQRQQLADRLLLARPRLAAMWLGRGDFASASGNLLNLPSVPNETLLLSALERSPALLQQLALQRLADARLQLAKANGSSDLQLGVGLRRFEESSDQALTFSLSMPLTFKNPNRGRIAEASSKRELALAQTRLGHQVLQLELLAIHRALENEVNQAKRLKQQLLPKARTLLEDTKAGYQMGRYSVLQWTDAQAELFALQREQIETHTRIYLQLLELERITAQPMSGAGQGETS